MSLKIENVSESFEIKGNPQRNIIIMAGAQVGTSSNNLHKYYTNTFILPCCLWGEEMVFWLTWKLIVLRWDEDDLLVSRSWNNSTPFLSSLYFPVLCFNKTYTLHCDTVVIIHCTLPRNSQIIDTRNQTSYYSIFHPIFCAINSTLWKQRDGDECKLLCDQ